MAISPAAAVVRVRAPRHGLGQYAVALAGLVPMTAHVWLRDPETWMWVTWGSIVVLVGLAVAREVRRPRGVDLREDAAVVVGPFRVREVPWRDVQAVAFGKRGMLTLHLAGGGEVRCLYPSHNAPFVKWRRVDEDFHRVGQWWLAHRGPDWRPEYAPSAPAGGVPPTGEDIWRTPPEAWR
jgi:hypothetical protein